MKKLTLSVLAMAAIAIGASAQAVERPGFFDNVSLGLDGGVTTPMRGQAFFGSMRGNVGLHVAKQITPVLGLGVEGVFGINTSSWEGYQHSSTAFDNSYVGVYGTADLFNLFGGYKCAVRPFNIEAVLGAGWGHNYVNDMGREDRPDYNYFATKAGLNFNFNVTDRFTVSLKPYVLWNMAGDYDESSVAYNINKATFNLMAGVSYRFGDGFDCVRPYDQGEVDALNSQVNALRGEVAASTAAAQAWETKANGLAAELQACRDRKPEVIKEVTNNFSSVRFVFFRVGSHKVTADQMPNVEMIADYMKNHPKSTVTIKGYASPEGNFEFNVKLAQNRAEAVKLLLTKRYHIAADRITAEGEGIGNMFEEESWNR